MSWAKEMVAELVEAKRYTLDFDAAWKEAIWKHPPPMRDREMVAFMRRACGDAWYGRNPLLRHMPGMLDEVDHDGTAVVVRKRQTGVRSLMAA